MIGKTVTHYKIIEKIGEGGMGTVYKAEDTKLKRVVALKFLNPQSFESDEHRQRFIREAQVAAALDHPNICTIYEFDEDGEHVFMAMAFIDGEDLKRKIKNGHLSLETTIDYATQIARGLEAAHKKGVIHRDIKSANIMITEDGQVKITDFGLARIVGSKEISKATMSIGTAAYMAPEQGRREKADHRTDIWALGVVMYEMLTGELPFTGDYDAAVVYSVINEPPRPLRELNRDVPDDIQQIVERAMAKRPDNRYQDAASMIVHLESPSKVVTLEPLPGSDADEGPKAVGIAVLPFADVSQKKDQDYLCDGIAEEIINHLAQVEGLHVVARTSAFSFKDKNEDIREIGRKLGVDTLLEGSVRKAGDRLRITAQLITASDGYHLWSERYDREMEDVFTIQDEITMAIVDKLKVTLLGEEKDALVKRYTEDVEAYNLYLKGRFFWNKRTETGYLKGLEYFRQATDQDPSYALAYAGIADSYDLLGWYGYLSPQEAFPRARKAAERAMELDDTLAEAHASSGWISANYDWDWANAEKQYNRALELNPNYATAHQWYAELLTYMGRHDDSITEAKKALELDPLSLIISNDLGQVYYFARRYDEAIYQLRKTLEMDPGFLVAHFFLALTYAQRAMYDDALRTAQRAMAIAGEGDSLILTQLGIIYSLSGKKDNAREVLDELQDLAKHRYVSPFRVALVYVGLGQNDKAFWWLDKACQERDHWMETLKVHPALDGLRTDERYADLLKQTGLDS
ncbi:MAG: protein kinase [Candidatus Latescibacterota bacterium]|nr:MAG: protein kinase [Candidatus Latescibacterota bacterium]